MKTPEQIKDDIKAREAELSSLEAEHQKDVTEFNQRCQSRRDKAQHLQGIIEALSDLVKEEKDAAS